MNYKLLGSAVSAVVLCGVVIYVSLSLAKDSAESALNLLVVVLGLSAGWLLGILLSPYTGAERQMFGDYAKAFGVFASGYLVAKLDKVFDGLLAPEFILDPVRGFRAMAFLTSLIIGLVVTFVFRRYG